MTLSREEVLKKIEEVRANVDNQTRPFSVKVSSFFDSLENRASKKAETTLAAIVAATASLGGTGNARLDSIIYGSVVCGILLGAGKSAIKSALQGLSVRSYESSPDELVAAFHREIDKIKATSSSNDFNHIHDYSRILVLGDYKKRMMQKDGKLSDDGATALDRAKMGFNKIFLDHNQPAVELAFAKKYREKNNQSLDR
jgi:hypothetical protein